MNPSQIPYFFLYCASQNYAFFHPYGYPIVLPDESLDLTGENHREYQSEERNNDPKMVKQVSERLTRKFEDRELAKRKQKKLQSIRKQQKDMEFKQRQQTTNRNLCSNTLKIFFKQLRDKNSQTYLNINKIIEVNKIGITRQEFMAKVDRVFPTSSTYISFDNVKKVCNLNFELSEDNSFAIVLRISMKRFYSYEIYAVNIKSIRTTRKIRSQQIKQGKLFLREFSL